jgi:AraC family transcriptional regulator
MGWGLVQYFVPSQRNGSAVDRRGSNLIVPQERGKSPEPLFPASSILHSSGDVWRDLSAERLRLTLETPEHHHEDHFLTLQLGPPALIEAEEDGRRLRLRTRPGEFSLIGANAPHRVRYEGADVLAVSLSPALVQRVADEVSRGAGGEPIEFVPQHGIYDPQIERLVLLLKAELETGCPTGSLFADGVGQALAAHLLRRYSTTPGREESDRERGGLSAARLRRALDFLEDNLDRDVSLDEIAAAAGLSPYHFTRQFKAATGLAPHAYLIARRVERAKDLLTRTDLPVAAVAAAAGFSHQSHLTRHFKRLVGTTPARFR